MKKKTVAKKTIIITVFIVFLASLIFYNVDKYFGPNISLFIKILVFLSISFSIVRIIGKYVETRDIPNSQQIGTQVKISGYILSILIVFSFFKELSSTILTIGTVGGLILGLTLQPVLGNFFAGVLIMSTKFVEVGKTIRILSSSIPLTITPLPSYKFFSVENADAGYKGKIIEIDWFYSLLETDEGKIIKIPNLLLLNSAIIDYSKEISTYSLRVEFPLKLKKSWNLKKIYNEVKKILKKYNVVEGPYFNEQSDKNYVFLRMRIKSRIKNWEEEKSEILFKLLTLKEKVEKA
ncbi:MAG: mechanosensitive ion channel family protein [Candidatus Aenigmatarchaeota archaeon]